MIYLIFNEGYSATAGDQWMRTRVSVEALRLGRIMVRLAPGSWRPGLVSLMEDSALRWREPAPEGNRFTMDQDRSRWDQVS